MTALLRFVATVAAIFAIYVGATHSAWPPIACGICTLVLVAAGGKRRA